MGLASRRRVWRSAARQSSGMAGRRAARVRPQADELEPRSLLSTFPGVDLAAVPTATSSVGGHQTDAHAAAIVHGRVAFERTTTTLEPPYPNPAAAGHPVTFQIHVEDEGHNPPDLPALVWLNEGETVIKRARLNSSGDATIYVPNFSPGQHTIVAEFPGGSSGETRLSPSWSKPATVGIVSGTTAGLQLTSVRRFGVRTQPTSLVLTFSQPLDAASAENVHNYVIVDRRGREIPVVSAVYDPHASAVTLTPQGRLSLRRRYHLTVNGTAPDGVRSAAGTLLEGVGNGEPGTDFHTTITAANLRLRLRPQPRV